ncbi:hypothetical protein JX266_003398 [Neoarthrinium moseri]|nr:hypothetical protein JX266_003398 [Neoarthrinium moseri]
MESQQPNLFAVVAITMAAATLTLVLRLIARRMTKVPLWWDDYLCILAYFFGVAWSALLLSWVPFGFGLHLKDVGTTAQESLTNSLFFCYLAELFYAFSLAFSKLAILSFYWRMFQRSAIKIPIIILAICAVVWLILRTFLAIFHCVPVQAFWDKSIPDATCLIDDSKFFFGSVLAHLVLDLAILTLPVVQVHRLQLRTAQKVGVTAMFMFGILVCIASVIVLVYSISYDTKSSEMSWNIAPIMIWATVEVNLAIISACMPMLRPIFMKAFHRIFPHASLGSSEDRFRSNRTKSFIQMAAMRTKTKLADDSESMHHLAESPRDNSFAKDDSFGGRTTGPKVSITGNEVPYDVELASSPPGSEGGILVRSETFVRVSQARI